MYIKFFVISDMSETVSLNTLEGIQTHLKSHLSARGLVIINNVRRSRKKRILTIAISTSLTKTLSCSITRGSENGKEGAFVNIVDQHGRVTASISKPEKFFRETFEKIFNRHNQPEGTSSGGMMGDALLVHGLDERSPTSNLFVGTSTGSAEEEVVGDFNGIRTDAKGQPVALQG